MLFYETIEPPTLAILKQLMNSSIIDGFNLAGGTALALQIGHRLIY